MLCLGYFLPGKAGKIFRRIFIPITGILLAYAICWAMILKGLDFSMKSADLIDQSAVLLNLDVKNTSFGDINLIDLNFYNEDDDKVNKSTSDLPLFIGRFSSSPLSISFDIDEYKKVELTVRILGLKKTFKTDMKKNE